jgi:hypothetical protein
LCEGVPGTSGAATGPLTCGTGTDAAAAGKAIKAQKAVQDRACANSLIDMLSP